MCAVGKRSKNVTESMATMEGSPTGFRCPIVDRKLNTTIVSKHLRALVLATQRQTIDERVKQSIITLLSPLDQKLTYSLQTTEKNFPNSNA